MDQTAWLIEQLEAICRDVESGVYRRTFSRDFVNGSLSIASRIRAVLSEHADRSEPSYSDIASQETW